MWTQKVKTETHKQTKYSLFSCKRHIMLAIIKKTNSAEWLGACLVHIDLPRNFNYLVSDYQ